ncbi:DNA mismatch repair endonuclease MutL [Limobrevibacterium gyesilva]|uniref:DNA mismatch repair protein MutL n=1 Tax=Limobrevibacterium gyesilva TaxID=2991712 RepID=A0AA41YHD8_9PROT|nr:DNA mismatch repair endonuclease MutL [Limobrevibacterium gyesilva]MCW3473324.1 DNA mismatch repair endonuclease MutL [Limobrevibacterium gyesilva]
MTIAGRIRLLPEATVNRIAAGEVIERPAAAARELIENALDAGARRVSVAIDGGGIDRIEVVDDGSGMAPDELALAVQRHATSKLSDDSLVRISTLGFRGEALPSIGAAARLSIVTRCAGADHAATILVEGGHVGAVAPAAGGQGTRVTVRDLFFATPARRKFLKSPRAEADAAEVVVRRLALAAPGVAFRLESDARVVFDLPAQERAARIAALLGPEAAATLLPVDGARGALRLTGFACAPMVTRATAAGQTLVVNGRPVVDPVLRTAVRVAYRHVIAAGRHPLVALFLELPPEEVDINVHPAKAEVRFREPDAVRALVIGSLGRALAGGAGGVAAPIHLGGAQFQSRPPQRRPNLQLAAPADTRQHAGLPAGFAEARLPLEAGPSARVVEMGTPDRYHGPFTNPAAREFPLGAAVAQVLDTYIIAVAADGSLVLVDQHAAHERLTHESLREQVLEGGVRTQPLLLPAVVDMPQADVHRLVARAADLASLGLEIEAFGPGAVLVRAMPAVLGAPDPGPLLRDLAEEFGEMGESTALSVRLDAVIARMACHGSIRAGRRLASPEMDALLRQMEATPRAATCSHGRPTFLKLTKAEIERLFGRR